MNAPHIPPMGEAKLSPAAQETAYAILEKMQRGMRYEEAYAETMASIPRNPGLPRDTTHSGKQNEVQGRIDRLAKAVEAAPGSTKLQLRMATGLSEWQFQRAIDRLVLDGRVRKEIDQRINLGHYWPITPKGTADT